MKKCPFCAEQIQDEAIICRFCGRDQPQRTAIGGVVVEEGFQGGTPPERREPTTPPAPAQPPAKSSSAAVGCLVIVGVIAFFAFIVALMSPSETPEKKAEAQCTDTGMAFYMSHEFVKKRLRAPATAQFPSRNDEGVAVSYLGDCTHDVVAYVDSQNGFGALVRSNYTAKIKNIKGTDEWQAISVTILDR